MNKKNKIKNLLLLTIFMLVVSVFLAFGIIEGAKDILGFKIKDKQVEIIIPKGSTTNQIANILKNKEIIEHPFIFKIYSKLKKSDGSYGEGKYILNSKMSYNDIIYSLQHLSERTDLVKVTIPEGTTLIQISNILSKNNVCDKEEFLDFMNQKKFISKALSEVEENEMILYRLEGYLFPDTYEFVLNDKPEYVVDVMTKNFDKKVYMPLKDEIKKSGMSLSEVVTLASIIQKESSSIEIMKKVGSVFLNRLNNPAAYQRLQSDVTIFYIETDIKPSLKLKNQKMYDSYNTYVCKGLPVGPICNPGLDAIKAVLEPEKTDYTYFLTDINNNYYWAKTLAEHNNNLYKAEKIGSVKGIDTDY